MKQLFALALSIVLFTGPLLAQDFSPYSRMTLEELLAVDTGALGKAAKKDYQKALKAAKAAARTHEKAEQKRRKAEVKAIQEHNKAVDKILAQIDRTFEKSSLHKDDFEAYTRISGPYDTNGVAAFGASDHLVAQRYWLEAFYDPNSAAFPVRLYISDQVVVKELNEKSIKGIKGKPERYLARKGHWNNFIRATLRGGDIRRLQPTKRYMDTCDLFECFFREEFYIELDADDLLAALGEFKSLDVKIANPAGDHYIFSLPYPYVIGFFKRFGDIQPGGESIREGVLSIETGIRGWKKAYPAE